MLAHEEHLNAALNILPRKPSYVGYTIERDDLTQSITKWLSEHTGIDMHPFASEDLSDDDSQYLYVLDDYAMEEELTREQCDDIEKALGASFDEYYEYTSILVARLFGIQLTPGIWVHVQGYQHSHYVDVQVGVPQ